MRRLFNRLAAYAASGNPACRRRSRSVLNQARTSRTIDATGYSETSQRGRAGVYTDDRRDRAPEPPPERHAVTQPQLSPCLCERTSELDRARTGPVADAICRRLLVESRIKATPSLKQAWWIRRRSMRADADLAAEHIRHQEVNQPGARAWGDVNLKS